MKTSTLICAILLLLSVGCNGRHTFDDDNSPSHQIKVGETVDIYVKENSCCTHCWVNEKEAVALKHIETVEVQPAPRECDGCNSTYAWRFEGIAEGTDTIKIAKICASEDCSDYREKNTDSIDEVYTITVNQ